MPREKSSESIEVFAGKGTSKGRRMKLLKFSTVKHDYLEMIRYEKKLAPKTHTTYQSWLNRYERWLGEHGYPDADVECAMSATVVRTYYYALSGGKITTDGREPRPRTLRAAISPLRLLGDYLVEHKVLTENPVKTAVHLPKKDAATRLLVSDIEVLALLEAAQRQVDSRKVALSSALLAALLYTGVRATELVNIRPEDVSLDREELLIAHGKGGKSRMLYPAPEFFVAVKAWLAERERMGCELPTLWAQTPRRPISYEWLLSHLEGLKAIAGYKGAPNIKPHSLRHWFATNLYRQTQNIKVVQQALGHSDAATTYIYLHLHEDDCRAMSKMTVCRPADNASASLETRTGTPSPEQHGAPSSTKLARRTHVRHQREPRGSSAGSR